MLKNIEFVDVSEDTDKKAAYANTLFELRKAKGMTEEQAKQQVNNKLVYAMLMLRLGDADGVVSGACHSTANTLRPGLQVIKTAPGIKTVSSSFIFPPPRG